jgi:D-alanine-D-alanine ligase
MRVAVVFGGCSVEHEISIITGIQAIVALNKAEYEVIPVYLTKKNVFTIGKNFDQIETFKKKDFKKKEVFFTRKGLRFFLKTKKIDVVLSCVHGKGLEGGELAGFFEILKIPYTSMEVLGASLGQDKIMFKKVMKYDHINVVDFVGFSNREWKNKRQALLDDISKLSYPLIIKASNLGSSIGIQKVHKPEDLESTIANIFKFDDRVLVEEVIKKFREFNCSMIGDSEISLIEEVVTPNEILTFNDKYEDGLSQRIVPAKINPQLEKEIYDTTKRVCEIVNNKGVSRIDYLYDVVNEKLHVNEINTIPGSLSYYLYEGKGLYFDELLDLLIDKAIIHNYQKEQKVNSFSSNILNMKGIKK